MTDVWTSVGVVAGVALVAITGWQRLDPLIALLVAANIILTGASLVRRFIGGLMDRALPPEQRAAVDAVLQRHAGDSVRFHAVRTRSAGPRAFVSVHGSSPATGPSSAATTSPST
jgi:divalent metal cation (Fe/Co/Zn/Cd) transporter